MADGPPRAVLHALRRLDREQLRAFVRDLYRARGWTVRVEDEVVVATAHGTTRVVLPVAGRRGIRWRGRLPDRPVDVVFAPSDGRVARRLASAADARLVAGDDVLEMAWYAVDSDDRTSLLRRHLGAAPADLRLPVRLRLRRRAATVRSSLAAATTRRRAWSVRAVVLALLALLSVVVFGPSAGLPVPSVWSDATTGASATDGSTVSVTPTVPPPVSATVPGLSSTGIADAGRLARAHRRALASRSYRAYSRYVGPPRGNASAPLLVRATSIVDGRETYLWKRITTHCGGDRVVTEVYFDGRTDYVVSSEGRATARRLRLRAHRYRSTDVGRPNEYLATLIERYLATNESRVVGTDFESGQQVVRVVATGRPARPALADARNYTAEATITTEGVVRDLTVSYVPADADPSRRVQLFVVLRHFNDTRTWEPKWYVRLVRNGTTAGHLAPRYRYDDRANEVPGPARRLCRSRYRETK